LAFSLRLLSCSWVSGAHPLSKLFMQLVVLHSLFRSQHLIELRFGFGTNCYEFSQETTLFSGKLLYVAAAVGYLGCSGKLFAVLFQLLPDRLG